MHHLLTYYYQEKSDANISCRLDLSLNQIIAPRLQHELAGVAFPFPAHDFTGFEVGDDRLIPFERGIYLCPTN